MWFLTSKSAKAIIWLHRNDPKGWVDGTHASVHLKSGIGVWTANKAYGLHVEYNCDPEVAKKGHMNGTRAEDFNSRSKKALWVEFRRDKHETILDAIWEWANANGSEGPE